MKSASSDTITVTPITPSANENPTSPRAREKYRPDARLSPSSFESQPIRDAISALSSLGRAAVGLAVCAQRAAQVARPDPGRGHVPPRRVRVLVLGQLGRRLPLGERRAVVVQPVERLAQPDHRRGRDRGVVEPDHALVEAGRVDEVGVGHVRRRLRERGLRGVERQRAGLREQAGGVEGGLVRGHCYRTLQEVS